MTTEKEKLKTLLILKYGSIQDLLYKWCLSDDDFLGTDEKEILIEYWNSNPRHAEYGLEELEAMRIRNLRAKWGIFS